MEHGNLVLSNELIKIELPPCKIWKADVSSVSASSFALTKGRQSKRQLSSCPRAPLGAIFT